MKRKDFDNNEVKPYVVLCSEICKYVVFVPFNLRRRKMPIVPFNLRRQKMLIVPFNLRRRNMLQSD